MEHFANVENTDFLILTVISIVFIFLVAKTKLYEVVKFVWNECLLLVFSVFVYDLKQQHTGVFEYVNVFFCLVPAKFTFYTLFLYVSGICGSPV